MPAPVPTQVSGSEWEVQTLLRLFTELSNPPEAAAPVLPAHPSTFTHVSWLWWWNCMVGGAVKKQKRTPHTSSTISGSPGVLWWWGEELGTPSPGPDN